MNQKTKKCREEHPILCIDPAGEIPLRCGLPKGHGGLHEDERETDGAKPEKTEEELHTKADIAKELAFRDQQIARLRASFECYNAEWHAEALRDNDRLRETVRKREQEHLDACAEADELRAEVARLTKLLDVCDVTHTHNVALKDERGRLRAEVERLREALHESHVRCVHLDEALEATKESK